MVIKKKRKERRVKKNIIQKQSLKNKGNRAWKMFLDEDFDSRTNYFDKRQNGGDQEAHKIHW